jgi:SAM-dependent methyltransferase
MVEQSIRFDDADAYERGMAPWSQLAGQAFLNWLSPPAGLRWLDVGCGTGAFTELIAGRCAPIELLGVDLSEAQFAVAKLRSGTRGAGFHPGDAMGLPHPFTGLARWTGSFTLATDIPPTTLLSQRGRSAHCDKARGGTATSPSVVTRALCAGMRFLASDRVRTAV